MQQRGSLKQIPKWRDWPEQPIKNYKHPNRWKEKRKVLEGSDRECACSWLIGETYPRKGNLSLGVGTNSTPGNNSLCRGSELEKSSELEQ